MGTRFSLLQAIDAAVADARAVESPVDVDGLAIKLSSLYPQSGLTIDTICDLIVGLIEARRMGNTELSASDMHSQRPQRRAATDPLRVASATIPSHYGSLPHATAGSSGKIGRAPGSADSEQGEPDRQP